MTARHAYSDEPFEDLTADALDRGRLVRRAAKIFRSLGQFEDSAVLAVVGPWGSGKTTLLNAVANDLVSSGGWRIVRNNPWTYTNFDTAVAGFFGELQHAIPDDKRTGDTRLAIGKFTARLAPVGGLFNLLGVDATSIVEKAAEIISGDQSLETLRTRVEEQLRKLDFKILVLMDDLDRLEPPELLITFRIVRLLGRLPNVFYLLAYDEATLGSVLSQTGLIDGQPGRVRSYLEKMVQVRIDIPPMLERQQAEMFSAGFDDFLRRHGLVVDNVDQSRLGEAWRVCLSTYLTEPRTIKRLLTQIDAGWDELNGEVDVVDFILTTFLRTFESRVFDLIVRRRDQLVGNFTLSDFKFHQEKPEEQWKQWVGLLAAESSEHSDELAELTAIMFPLLESASKSVSGVDSGRRESTVRRSGIGSDEFFDRYTQGSVPAGDIPHSQLLLALDELVNRREGSALSALRHGMVDNAAQVVGRLSRLNDLGRLPAHEVLIFLGQFYDAARKQSSGPFGLGADHGSMILALRLLDRSSSGDAAEWLSELCNWDGGLMLAADVTHKAVLEKDKLFSRPWAVFGRFIVASSIDLFLRDKALTLASPTFEHISRLVWPLLAMTSGRTVQDLFWDLIGSYWSIQEVLASLVPPGTVSNGVNTRMILGELDVGVVSELLGINRLREALGAITVPISALESFDRYDLSDTQANRIQYALAVAAEAVRRADNVQGATA